MYSIVLPVFFKQAFYNILYLSLVSSVPILYLYLSSVYSFKLACTVQCLQLQISLYCTVIIASNYLVLYSVYSFKLACTVQCTYVFCVAIRRIRKDKMNLPCLNSLPIVDYPPDACFCLQGKQGCLWFLFNDCTSLKPTSVKKA